MQHIQIRMALAMTGPEPRAMQIGSGVALNTFGSGIP